MSPKKRIRGGTAHPAPAAPPAQPPPSPLAPPGASPGLIAFPTIPHVVATQFVPATQDHAPHEPPNPGAPTQDDIDNVAPTAQTTITPDQPLAQDTSPGDRVRLVMRTFPLLDSPQKNLLLQLTLDVSRDRDVSANIACGFTCCMTVYSPCKHDAANMMPCTQMKGKPGLLPTVVSRLDRVFSGDNPNTSSPHASTSAPAASGPAVTVNILLTVAGQEPYVVSNVCGAGIQNKPLLNCC